MRVRELRTERVISENFETTAGLPLATEEFVTTAVSGITPTEADFLDGALAGTVVASKTSVYDAAGKLYRSSASPAAAGNAITNATALTAELNAVTGADGTKGVKLPVAAADEIVVIINTDATNNLLVYPVAGSQINALGASNAFTITPGQRAEFLGRSATLWYTAAATDTITGLTATAGELNVLAGVTPGTNAASKAVVAGADGKVGALTFDGAVTTEADPLTTAGVGAVVATVVATEKGDGVLHKTVLTCTATAFTFGDEAGQGQYGGTKIYDFPAGLVTVFGAVVDGALTLTAPAIDTWVGDVGLGVEAPTDHQDVAGKTGSVMQKNDIAAAVAKVAQLEAKSVATALTESGARWLDGTGTAKDLFLNILVDDNVAHDNTITGTFTGTVTILWANIGDIA